jgi:hypothetical protein
MHFADYLTFVSGAASLASLLLTLWDRFASWRKFLLPVAWGLAGFAAGRLSLPAATTPSPSSPASFPSTETLLFLALLAVICFGAFALLRRNEPIWAYMLFSLGLGSAGPAFLKSYGDVTRQIPAADFVLLSADKEKVGDFSGAILYLDRAYNATDDGVLHTKVREHKENLQTKLVESVSSQATTPK